LQPTLNLYYSVVQIESYINNVFIIKKQQRSEKTIISFYLHPSMRYLRFGVLSRKLIRGSLVSQVLVRSNTTSF